MEAIYNLFSMATEQRESRGDGTYSGDEGLAARQILNRKADRERAQTDMKDGKLSASSSPEMKAWQALVSHSRANFWLRCYKLCSRQT